MEDVNLTPKITIFHRLFKSFALRAIHFFYPTITYGGTENIAPADVPTIYVLTHPNFILDLTMLARKLDQRFACLAKSTFFNNPLMRFALYTFGALPIYRKQDEGEPGGPQGDASERNRVILAHCRHLLEAGKTIALFPEGTTHSEPNLLPLQTGAARLALDAEATADWQLGVRVIPVGVQYQQKTNFRTAARVVFGEPVWAKSYKAAYHADNKEAEQIMTNEITERLAAVWETAEQTLKRPMPTTTQQVNLLQLFLVIMFPFAMLGRLLNYLPAKLVPLLVQHGFSKKATRQGTGKLITGLILFPLSWLLGALGVGMLFGKAWGKKYLLTVPILGYIALRWSEVQEQLTLAQTMEIAESSNSAMEDD